MHQEYTKAALLGLWLVSVIVALFMLDLTSPAHITALALFVVAPPAVAAKLWGRPEATMSEAINEARR